MFLPATTIRTVVFSLFLLLLSALLAVEGTFVGTINTSEDYCVIGERPRTMSSSDSQQKYEAGTHSIAFVTTPNANSAKELARKLVEHKLAACVNIIPGLTSVYEWEGAINQDLEILLMIKTRTSRVDELIKFVRGNHPYSVAEVITVPIENGNPPYLDWLSKIVPEGKK